MTIRARIGAFRRALAHAIHKGSWDDWLMGGDLPIMSSSDDISDGYKQHIWVYGCVNRIARSVASVRYMLERGGMPLSPRMRDGLAINSLFTSADIKLTRFQLWERTVADLLLRGNAFWLKSYASNGRPVRFQVLLATYMAPVFDTQTQRLTEWVYGGTKRIKPADMVHFRLLDHTRDEVGLSPLDVANLVINTDYKAMLMQHAIFVNGAEPGIILSTDSDTLTEDEVKLIQAQWSARHQGPRNIKKTAVLPKGIEPHVLGLSAKEMEYLGLRKFSREDLCTCYGVPMALFGVTEDVNYATHRGLKRIFWEDTVIPMMHLLEDQIAADIFQPYYSDIRGYFDLGEIIELQRDIPQEATAATKFFHMGYSRDQINGWMRWGFEPDEYSSEHYLPSNIIPIDMAGQSVSNPNGPDRPEGPEGPGRPRDPDAEDGEPNTDEPPPDYNAISQELEKRLPGRIRRSIYKLRNTILHEYENGSDQIEWSKHDLHRHLSTDIFQLLPTDVRFTNAASHVLNDVCHNLALYLDVCDTEADVKSAFNMLNNRSAKLAGAIISNLRQDAIGTET